MPNHKPNDKKYKINYKNREWLGGSHVAEDSQYHSSSFSGGKVIRRYTNVY